MFVRPSSHVCDFLLFNSKQLTEMWYCLQKNYNACKWWWTENYYEWPYHLTYQPIVLGIISHQQACVSNWKISHLFYPLLLFLQKMNGFFLSSVLKCAMWVLDSSPLVSAIEICSLKHSWWRYYHLDLLCDLNFYCVILVGVFFHCWLSQQSVVVNWWLPQFLSSEFAPKYHPCGLLLVDFSSNVSSPDHGLGGKDLWEPDLSHWKLLT